MDILDIVSEALATDEQRARNGLLEDGYDLPELADTMEEADARAAADRYLRALGGIEREMDANDAEFTTLKAYYADRHGQRQATLDGSANYLRGVLKGLFGFMTTGKKKSLNLLGGRIGMRSQADELVVEDDAAVIMWAKMSMMTQHLVVETPRIDRKALRAYMQPSQDDPENQEPMPLGVKLEERPDQFFARPAE